MSKTKIFAVIAASAISAFATIAHASDGYPGAVKYYDGKPGMKMIAVIECNDVNPLNVIHFTLKDSGKQFFDMVVLFAANINTHEQKGVHLSCNENIQALLNQREKYLEPLQQRGIKVILGILGNHDAAGLSTLTPEASLQFAKEVKSVCDTYELDGVFLDDEYTDYEAAGSGLYPIFKKPTEQALCQMAYDIKHQQPERLVMLYNYTEWNKAPEGVSINGEKPGEFIDYVLNDYWDTSNPVDSYAGLNQSQCAIGSWNCSDWSRCLPSNPEWSKRFSLTEMRDSGYGALMIFNFRTMPDYTLTPSIVNDLNTTSQILFNSEIEYDGSWLSKDSSI